MQSGYKKILPTTPAEPSRGRLLNPKTKKTPLTIPQPSPALTRGGREAFFFFNNPTASNEFRFLSNSPLNFQRKTA
jgi:hypothetical protein